MKRPSRRRPRLERAEHLSAIVERVERLERFPPRAAVDEALWVLVVGKVVAERTRPLKLWPDGTLVVCTSTASWSQELSFLQEDIRARLLANGVKTTRLRFQVGSVGPITTPVELGRTVRALPRKALPTVLQEALARVDDDGLRVAIAGAMERRM